MGFIGNVLQCILSSFKKNYGFSPHSEGFFAAGWLPGAKTPSSFEALTEVNLGLPGAKALKLLVFTATSKVPHNDNGISDGSVAATLKRLVTKEPRFSAFSFILENWTYWTY